MSTAKKINKWLNTIIIVLTCIIALEGVLALVFFRKIKMPTSEYTIQDRQYAINTLYKDYKPLSIKPNKYYRDVVAHQARLRLYFYIERDLGDVYNGATLVLIRTILIDETLTGEEYCMVFTHEVMHLKRYSGNETYVCFETFKFLYESDNIYLHNAGVAYGIEQLGSYHSGEYNCRDYIIDYLVRK